MNIIKATRTALNMSQAEFGIWLGKQLERASPIPSQRVNEWENGHRAPRKHIRKACAPIAALALANDAVAAIERTHLRDVTNFDSLPPDLRCARDEITDWVMDLIE